MSTVKFDTNRRRGAPPSAGGPPGASQPQRSYTLGVLICSNLLVLQLTSMYWWSDGFGNTAYTSSLLNEFGSSTNTGSSSTSLSSITNSNDGNTMHLTHPMSIPQGKAVNLPSVQVKETENSKSHDAAAATYYGGKGDKPHLGGFANGGIDFAGVSPAAWKFMIEKHGVQSLLDVGCGRGISTSWFYDHGVDAQCVEGSHDAVTQNFLAKEHPDRVTEHDFSRGPWWPTDTVDAVWSVEVLEHVSRNFHQNLIPAFRKGAIIYATHSIWGGHHHVEVHDTDWWIAKFQSFGFVYNDALTKQIKKAAGDHKWDPTPNAMANDGQFTNEMNHKSERYQAQHLWTHLMVFINPAVASLPKHNHLFAEDGCYDPYTKDVPEKKGHRKCGDPNIPGLPDNLKETAKAEMALPLSYLPLTITQQQDDTWEKRIFGKTSEEAKEMWRSKNGAGSTP